MLETFLIAMTPLLELRGAIPLALLVYRLPVESAFWLSVIGNLVPVLFLLLFLDLVQKFLSRRFYFFRHFFNWLFERTRRNHQRKFEIWQEFALIILVAIPLPLTGAWTGSLAAFVFGIPFKRAFPLIALGVIIAGLIVTSLTYATISGS